MASLILKNMTAAVVKLPRTGMQLPASGQDDYTQIPVAIRKLAASAGVRDLIDAGTVVVNNGTDDLNAEDGQSFLLAIGSAWGFIDAPWLCSTYNSKNGKKWQVTMDDDGIFKSKELT